MDDLIYETPLGIPRPSCSLPRVGVIATLYKQYTISELILADYTPEDYSVTAKRYVLLILSLSCCRWHQ